MSFFIRKAAVSKHGERKTNTQGPEKKPLQRKPRNFSKNISVSSTHKRGSLMRRRDTPGMVEDVSSDESDLEDHDNDAAAVESDVDETPEEKRIRLAKDQLERMARDERERDLENAESVHDAVSQRLEEQVLEKKGTLHRNVASAVVVGPSSVTRTLRGHRLSPTCVRLSEDGRLAFSGSKDGSLIKWDVETGKCLNKLPGLNAQTALTRKGHRQSVLSLALSSDSKFLVSGGAENCMNVWDTQSMAIVKQFPAHKASIMGLAFRRGTHQLFSASEDRTIKHWNLTEMVYVETLYGHGEAVVAVDSLHQERCLSVGGRDRTLRLWKIPEESHLVFNGPRECGSVECASMINEGHFVSGFENGSLALWSRMKKRPSCLVPSAHCSSLNPMDTWVTSVKALPNTDLVASGSRDGHVKLWKCSSDYRELTEIGKVPLAGFINDIQFADDGSFMLCAVGQEHRLGRWWSLKDAKNAVVVVKLDRSDE